MTDNLDNDTRKALVNYRIERAHNTLSEVEKLLNIELYSTAINRLYYAVYYAATALLLNDGYSTTTHAGVRSLLGLHYLKTGKISHDIGSNFIILFERRHRCDYDDFIDASKEEVLGLIPLAHDFVSAVDGLLKD